MYLFAWELLVFLIQDTPHSNILSCRVYLVTCPSLADKNGFALKTIPKSVLRDAEHRRHSMAGKEWLLKYKTSVTVHFRERYSFYLGLQVHHPAVPHLPGHGGPAHADGDLPGRGAVDPA